MGPGWVWTQAGGRQDLVGGVFSPNSGLYGISGDGNVVVGEAGTSVSGANAAAYRYDRTTGQLTNIGVQPTPSGTYVRSRAYGASLDGSTVVGLSSSANNTFAGAFRWTSQDGLQPLSRPNPQHAYTEARAVNADGSVIVGLSVGAQTSAIKWGPGSNATILPMLPGSTSSAAYGVNSSGNIIVGLSGPNSERRGVLWVDGSIVDLGSMPEGYQRSHPWGLSDDGSVVVGQIYGSAGRHAGIWRAGVGWQRLDQYLSSIGINIPVGLTLPDATGISRDGRTITGCTLSSNGEGQGFVAIIPAPSSLVIFGVSCLCAKRRQRVSAR